MWANGNGPRFKGQASRILNFSDINYDFYFSLIVVELRFVNRLLYVHKTNQSSGFDQKKTEWMQVGENEACSKEDKWPG